MHHRDRHPDMDVSRVDSDDVRYQPGAFFELYQADEVFLTGTAAEVVPVREIDDHLLGEPGELTQAIQKRFFEAIQGKREEYLEWLDFVDVEQGAVPQEQVGTA